VNALSEDSMVRAVLVSGHRKGRGVAGRAPLGCKSQPSKA
jgi:hypothetical protein